MTHVATIVCDPLSPVLTDDKLRQASEILSAQGRPQWLAHGIAADLFFEPPPAASEKVIADALTGTLAGAPVNVIVQRTRGRRKKLLLADMDSTMIQEECLDELAAAVGMRAHIAAITEQAMRGDIAFEPALRERVALLKGLDLATIHRVIAEKITLTPGGRTLVQTMRTHGAHTVLVSGGFSVFTSVIAERIGFHEHRANELLFCENGRLSGRIAEPILGKDGKLAALKELRQTHGLAADETLAVGDGANDLAMLEAAGLGIAYHAKPKVAAAAHARIDHGDLTVLLYAQGYPCEEFVSDPQEGQGEARETLGKPSSS